MILWSLLCVYPFRRWLAGSTVTPCMTTKQVTVIDLYLLCRGGVEQACEHHLRALHASFYGAYFKVGMLPPNLLCQSGIRKHSDSSSKRYSATFLSLLYRCRQTRAASRQPATCQSHYYCDDLQLSADILKGEVVKDSFLQRYVYYLDC